MPDGPPPRPHPLDRPALERVLARAAELQALTSDAPEALTDEQVVDLGREVGLTPDAIRQALAEERGRVVLPPPTDLLGRVFGGTACGASRVVPGTPAAVLARLDHVMRREAKLVEKRRFTDRLAWEVSDSFILSMSRAFSTDPTAGALALADEVGASVVPVDATRTFVRMDAALPAARRAAFRWTAAGVVLGSAVFLPLALIGVPVAVAAGVGALPGGLPFVLAREAYRKRAARVQLALEQVLDRLEFGAGR